MQTPAQTGAPRSILRAEPGASARPQQVGHTHTALKLEFLGRLSPRGPAAGRRAGGGGRRRQPREPPGPLPEFVLFLTYEAPREPRVLPDSGAAPSTAGTWETWGAENSGTLPKGAQLVNAGGGSAQRDELESGS